MSRFPNQLAVVSVSVLALTASAVLMSERAAHRAAEAAYAAEKAAVKARADASLAAEAEAPAELATEESANLDAEAPSGTPDVAKEDVAEAPASQGHGDPGTAPIASIIAGAAVAQSVDSPAMDATGIQYGLGRSATAEEVAAWDIDIRPDGQGLPDGSGDVWTGEEVFVENCAVCHGDFAEGVGRWPVLAGGHDTLTDDRPVKTIGSYWPYLSTVWDYVYRAMPFGYARSLEPDEVYAITAYLMYSNNLVDDDFVLSRENFHEVRLPNEDNFFLDDRAEGEIPAFTGAPCMENCKDAVEITARAAIIDVTPEGEEGGFVPAPELGETDANDVETVTKVTASPDQTPAAPASAVAPPDPALVAAGEAAFRQCKTCHQVGEGASNKVGPVLTGIVDSPAGAVDGFRYSNALKEAADGGLVWSEGELTAFLADPKGYMRGTKMSFNGVRKGEDIAALIAYLQSVAE